MVLSDRALLWITMVTVMLILLSQLFTRPSTRKTGAIEFALPKFDMAFEKQVETPQN
jgi:hypothetical protein